MSPCLVLAVKESKAGYSGVEFEVFRPVVANTWTNVRKFDRKEGKFLLLPHFAKIGPNLGFLAKNRKI